MMQYMVDEERLLPLPHMTNTRDLGGYETQEGYYTRAKRYVRGSSPYNATQEDLDILADYGITTVIDLRSDFEKEVHHSPLIDDERFENIEINLMNTDVVKVVPKEIREYSDLGGVYIFMLEAHKAQIKQVFDVFLDHPYDCVMFHCSAGKDRTGVIAALLMELAGCHDYDIVRDYSISYGYNLDIVESLEEIMDEATQVYLRSSPRYMLILLDFLREHYGSAKAYLMDIGLSEQDINDIKEMFVI